MCLAHATYKEWACIHWAIVYTETEFIIQLGCHFRLQCHAPSADDVGC